MKRFFLPICAVLCALCVSVVIPGLARAGNPLDGVTIADGTPTVATPTLVSNVVSTVAAANSSRIGLHILNDTNSAGNATISFSSTGLTATRGYKVLAPGDSITFGPGGQAIAPCPQTAVYGISSVTNVAGATLRIEEFNRTP